MGDRQQTEWSGVNPDKEQLRNEIWSLLKQEKAAVRDPTGHIPNFIGAELAAEQLAKLSIWQEARVVKCNPDSPQCPVRLKALQDGKTLYMAVPRLVNRSCFVELTAANMRQLGLPLEDAAIARRALTHGRYVTFEQMQPIDLVIVGCVAAAENGGRTGKGAGFADLELAMLRERGLVNEKTPIATTVHALQVIQGSRLPMLPHDWALTWIVTPEGAIETANTHTQPAGLDWDKIQPQQLKKIPALKLFFAPTS